MNELRIQSVKFEGDDIVVHFSDGASFPVSLSSFPHLAGATKQQRDAWHLIGRGRGVHWDLLDEDLSVENFLTAYSRQKAASYSHAAA